MKNDIHVIPNDKLIGYTTVYKTKELAESKKKEISESDPEWTYTVQYEEKYSGYIIKVYDEDGEEVGNV